MGKSNEIEPVNPDPAPNVGLPRMRGVCDTCGAVSRWYVTRSVHRLKRYLDDAGWLVDRSIVRPPIFTDAWCKECR